VLVTVQMKLSIEEACFIHCLTLLCMMWRIGNSEMKLPIETSLSRSVHSYYIYMVYPIRSAVGESVVLHLCTGFGGRQGPTKPRLWKTARNQWSSEVMYMLSGARER
jgi:hypothetical protein